MSKVERKEYMETRSTRTTTPTRIKGSNPNLSQFDNNLDNLLEDLQSTVSRPGSALALHNGHARDSSRSYNVNRSHSLNRGNDPIEYSTDDAYSYTSPDGTKNVKTTRKETYSYRTGGIQRGDLPPERVRMQNNINQLDSLLDDLQQVKQNGTIYNIGKQFGQDSGYHQGFSQNKLMSEKRIVERDLSSGYPQTIEIIERPVRDDPDAAITEFEEYKQRNYNKEMSSTSTRSVPALKTSSLSRNTKMSNIQQYPIEVVETTSHDINPEILANLDPELLPSGNTKVTTTIKTYTYEIPGGGNPTDIIASPNATILSSAHSTPSKSFVYNSAQHNSNYSSSQTHNNVLSHRKPQQPPSPTMGNKFQQQENRLEQQETITTRNYQPTNIVYEDSSNPNKRTYIYNETTLTRNPATTPMPAEKPYSPPQTPSHQPRHELRHHIATHESSSSQRSRSSDHQQHTTNVTNVHHHHHHGQPRSASTGRQSPYLNGIEPDYNVSEIIETFEAQAHSGGGGGGGGSAPSTPGAAGKPYPAGFIYPSTPPATPTPPSTPKAQRKAALPVTAGAHQSAPPSQSTVQYKSYTSTSNSSSNNQQQHGASGGGNYVTKTAKSGYYYNPNAIDPQAYPRRFPVDENDNAPPKDVQVLMKKIGAEPPTSPLNAGYIQHEQEMVQQRKVEQMKHQKEMEEQRKPDYYKDAQKSKNVTGPPVYYPPGHEMFARKEESGGWRAEGAMAKESGKYKYEAESKSKSKSSSGAAIVPVCLPLCCGLPCTIL